MNYMDLLAGRTRTIAPIVLRGAVASVGDARTVAATERDRTYADGYVFLAIDRAMRANRAVGI